MKYKKFLAFVALYVFFVLIVAYSFSFYRGRQINQFLERKNAEYKSHLNCISEEGETIEDWASVHACKAHCLSLEYVMSRHLNTIVECCSGSIMLAIVFFTNSIYMCMLICS